MTNDDRSYIDLDALSDEQRRILRQEAEDWLIGKAQDLPTRGTDPGDLPREAEEVAALGRIVAAVRFGHPMRMPDSLAKELIVRTLGETRHLDELKEEYDRELGEHEAWAALLAHFDPPANRDDSADDDGAEHDESQGDEPKEVRSPKWIELGGKLSEDQLRILRKEVTLYLAGRTGDLHLLAKSSDPDREIAEIAAVGRLAFWLCRGEIEAPDAIAEEMIIRLTESAREINDYEELRERYEAGKSEENALAAFATLLSEANSSWEGRSDA